MFIYGSRLSQRSSTSPLLFTVFLLQAITLAQQPPSPAERQKLIDESIGDAQQIISNIRPVLFANLNPQERRIYDRINFRITGDNAAWSVWGFINEGGSRVIEIDIGYIQKIEMMTDALFLEQIKERDIILPYVRYVVDQLQHRATFIKSPYQFIGMSIAEMDAFDADQETQKLRMSAVVNSIAFVLAHEVGHHVSGHYDNPPKDPESQRAAERQADNWAIQQMVKAHMSPLGGLVPLMFDFYFAPLGVTPNGNHPAPIERVQTVFQGMRNALPEFRHDLEEKGQSYSNYKRWLDTRLSELEMQMKAGSALTAASVNSGADPFCSAVLGVIDEAPTKFKKFAGPVDSSDPFALVLHSVIVLPGASGCTVAYYRDRTLGTSFICDYGRAASENDLSAEYERIASMLASCLSGWELQRSSKVRQQQVRFTHPGKADVRLNLRSNRSGTRYSLEMWVEQE